MSTWLVSAYSTVTDERLSAHEIRAPERAVVRKEWGLPPGTSVGPLLITRERLPFVNELLDEPLELAEGQEAYLEEYAEHPGELVDD